MYKGYGVQRKPKNGQTASNSLTFQVEHLVALPYLSPKADNQRCASQKYRIVSAQQAG